MSESDISAILAELNHVKGEQVKLEKQFDKLLGKLDQKKLLSYDDYHRLDMGIFSAEEKQLVLSATKNLKSLRKLGAWILGVLTALFISAFTIIMRGLL